MEGTNWTALKKNNYIQNDSVYQRCYIYIQHIFFKIIGLSPWAIDTGPTSKNRKNKNRNYEFNISYIGLSYNILLSLGIIIYGFYRIFDKSLAQASDKSPLLSVILKMIFITILCASLLPLIYIIRQKKLISVNNRFKNIDRVLNKCANYEIQNNRVNDFIFIANLLITYCLIITVSFFYYPARRVFFRNIPTVISGGVIIQYAMILNRVDKRFKSINSTISKLVKFKSNATQPQILFLTYKVLSRESFFNDIENLKYAYMELWEMCQDIGDFYGVPILIAMFCFAVKTIITVYTIILSLFDVLTIHIEWPVDSTCLLWIIFLFIVLTSSITKIKKQNKKLGRTINLLTDQNSMDERIKTKLSKFSSDLRNLKIELTACDIIPLDCRLLAIITGTIATYLIISIQFALNVPPDS
ncbi:uncharacterized protein LOC130664493 [Microplitis mediator]|uniref:uncharacterized protein LOC130664493 n=1 Tax=Microplitis mediator TaxID=375433 RepID=UPI0025525E1A|nr:uncharacterized protein LOC130664493 [Microplitis mediator]